LPTETFSSKAGETWREIAAKFFIWSISFHTCGFFLTWLKILRHGTNGFTSPPKEVVMRTFIALKNPSFSEVLNCRGYSNSVFCNLSSPTAHPTLAMAPEGTPQNFVLRK
jgi:hypothetical protein